MDEIEKYKKNLRARLEQLIERVDRGEATKDYVAFETLWSVFSAFEAGFEHNDIEAAYPLENWRQDTITIPRAIARRLADGWGEYRSSHASKNLGNAFKLEGGQGKPPVVRLNRSIDAEKRRSNKVLMAIATAVLEENSYKLESIYQMVAEQETQEFGKKVSAGTIKKAYLKHGKMNLETILEHGLKLREGSSHGS